MNHKLIVSDIKNNKGEAISAAFFFSASAFVFALTFILFSTLLGSINTLMKRAITPDYLQMHSGDPEKERIYEFSEQSSYIKDYQINSFLNIDNNLIQIAGKSLTDSTQDNGLCVQSERFDFLLDMENNVAGVKPGEILVPVCYRNLYKVSVGDEMKVGNYSFRVAGFLRDAQMNSMMASSKRFLVSNEDYEKVKNIGSEEYLIEFLLQDGKKISRNEGDNDRIINGNNNEINTLQAEYLGNKLPMNGPAVSYSLIRLMNALSDGILAVIILLISIVVLIISLICIRFILVTGLERSKKEIGLLKAVGISKKDIRRIYEYKFILLSAIGTVIGLVLAYIASFPLLRGTKELYGECENLLLPFAGTIISVIFVEAISIRSVHRQIVKLEKITVSEIVFRESLFGGGRKSKYILLAMVYVAAVFIMILPDNILTTISDPGFVTYMGIGNAKYRIDIRQCQDIKTKADRVYRSIQEKDINSVLLMTKQEKVMVNGDSTVLCVEYGNHEKFPVSYTEGRAPANENEIAVSSINAKDLSLSMGDSILINDNTELTVTGIYSDITNGGKTAKRYYDDLSSLEGDIQWAIIYLEGNSNSAIYDIADTNELKDILGITEISDIQVTDISEYVEGTYGQTIEAVEKASIAGKLIAASVLFAVTALFLLLIANQETMQNSLKKALGVSLRDIVKEFLVKIVIYPATGIAAGIVSGYFLSESIAGLALSGLGADGLKIIVNPLMVFLVIPLIAVSVFAISVLPAINNIRSVRAYDCVSGRE